MNTRIISQIALFVLGAVALDRTVGFALDTAAATVTTGEGLGPINRALSHGDADVLVLGSSRALRHVDPKVLKSELGLSTYNAGRDGQGVYYVRMLAALFLESKPKTKLFLVQAEPMDLYEGNPLKAKMFAPYVDRHPLVWQSMVTDYREQVKFFSHAYRYNSVAVPLAVELWARTPANPSDDGFRSLPGDMSKEPPLSSFEVAPNLPKSKPRVLKDEVIEQYRGLLGDAKAAGLKVVLFTGPRWRTVAADPKEVEAWDVYKRIAKEAGVPYLEIDEHTHPAFQDGRLYADHNHLNQEGAAMFSKILADLVRPIIAAE